MITMYAIKDNDTREYYNFEEDGFTELRDHCLIPTATLAIGYYDQYIGGNQKIVEVKVTEHQRGLIVGYFECDVDFADCEDIEG